MTEKKNLSGQQEKAIPFFVRCSTVDQACQEAGISRQTYYRLIEQSSFKEALDVARRQTVFEAFDEIKGSLKTAVRTLVSIMEDPTMPAQCRHGAATDIIGHALSWLKTEELEERITQLENRFKKGGHSGEA